MDIYVARQPIFRKDKKIYGYELLFRAGMDNFFPDIDGNTATSKLLSNSFLSIGIEKITGNNLAFINFTQELLVRKIPLMFSRDMIVVEVLEDVTPEKDVVTACREMAQKGYVIALDDFFYTAELEPLIALANIIKIDLRATSWEEIGDFANKLSKNGVKLLAEKVETHEEFRKALDMGFQYFQGYFFSKPEILQGKDISTPQMNLLEIMAEANRKDFQFGKLEGMIIRDVAISYKLLRLINSAYFRRVSEVSSIGQAIALIGETGIRRFLSLIAMSGLATEKPDELIRGSIIRAKYCELLGEGNGNCADPSELFTVGLFSLIDAIMDEPMEALMAKLPLSDGIKDALMSRESGLGDYLSLVESFEKGDWEHVSEIADRLGIAGDSLQEHYMEALGWADSLIAIQ